MDHLGAEGRSFCDTCGVIRSSGTKHCRFCNVCIDEYDHHCPWVAKCIGENNIVFFSIFIGSMVAMFFLIFIVCGF